MGGGVHWEFGSAPRDALTCSSPMLSNLGTAALTQSQLPSAGEDRAPCSGRAGFPQRHPRGPGRAGPSLSPLAV